MQDEYSKTYDLGYGHLGNGVTVWNRNEEEHGDYKTVAHISRERKVTFYDENLPADIKSKIQKEADTMEMDISATQKYSVFSIPPKKYQ